MPLHPALQAIRDATLGTSFDGDLFLVGGAVRDELLGAGHGDDFDLVTRGSSAELAHLLFERGLAEFSPVTYERFGTAMVRVGGIEIEIVTARKESYDESSRKPVVEPASILEDALRRDFTVNTLMRSLHTGELSDPTSRGLEDMRARTLRTPLEPGETFHDDPLRMLRAVRFRWKLGFDPAPGLYDAIRETRDRLQIVSMERIRDELVKMMLAPSAPSALADLMELGLFEVFLPELLPMVGCEQGHFHHLPVWEHSLLVLSNVIRDEASPDLILRVAALLHDVGKPSTRFVDAEGSTRFFGHEAVGASMAHDILRRLKFPQRDVETVARLVRNHMRLGSSPVFTATAARRLLRDMEADVDRLLALVEADADGLKASVRRLDLTQVRAQLAGILDTTPTSTLQSPLTGEEIMALTGLAPGREVGRIKDRLTEMVLEGTLAPQDREGARAAVLAGFEETVPS